MRFLLDEPKVVLEPEAEEEGFEIRGANPHERVAWAEVGKVEVFFGHVEAFVGGDYGVIAVGAEIEIPKDAPLLVVQKSPEGTAIAGLDEAIRRVEVAGGAG